jgi:phospholipid N-methyltransferase
VHYLREYLKKPTEIGALAPSSDELAKAMLKGLDLENARTVLEYGPGSGSVTDHIRRKISPHTKLAAIEVNPRMAELFRDRHPDVRLFQDTVANARMICDCAGMDSVDCVISSLPWATFSEVMQVKFLDEMMRVLRPGGDFVTFAYVHALALPMSKRFANLLHRYFGTISKSPVVWRNVPPALVYRCRR